MKKKIKENITEISIIDQQCPIPLESLAILVTGDDNKNFKCLSKKITTDKVKVNLKHRNTGERVKLTVPIEFLELHKITYKNPIIPSDIQIIGALLNTSSKWEVKAIIPEILLNYDLVLVKCLQSNKIIACKIETKLIKNTKGYLTKVINKDQFRLHSIDIWRETECQKEIQMNLN